MRQKKTLCGKSNKVSQKIRNSITSILDNGGKRRTKGIRKSSGCRKLINLISKVNYNKRNREEGLEAMIGKVNFMKIMSQNIRGLQATVKDDQKKVKTT